MAKGANSGLGRAVGSGTGNGWRDLDVGWDGSALER